MPGQGWVQIEDSPVDKAPRDYARRLPGEYYGLETRTCLYYVNEPFIGPVSAKRQRISRDADEEDNPEDADDEFEDDIPEEEVIDEDVDS